MTTSTPLDPTTAAASTRWPGGLGAEFGKVWTAAVASSVGTGFHFASFPLLAATVTVVPGRLALVTAVGSLPWLLLALPAGAWVDRGDARRIMVVTDLSRAVVMAALSLELLFGNVGLPAVLAASMLLGVGEVFFDCAAMSFLPRVVPDQDLERANGRLFSGMQAGQNLIGQLLGGTLFQLARVLPFALNCVALATSAALLGSVRTSATESETDSDDATVGASQPPRRILGEIGEGLRVVARNRPFLAITAVSAVMNGVYLGELAVLVLYSSRVLNLSPQYYGALLTAQAIGGVLGGILTGRLIRALGRGPVLLISPAMIGAASIALGLADGAAMAFTAFAMMGLSAMVWNVIAVSYRQTFVPRELLGRANGVYRLVSWGCMPLGSVAFGLAADTWGLRTPFVLGGILVAAVSVVLLPFLSQLAGPAESFGDPRKPAPDQSDA